MRDLMRPPATAIEVLRKANNKGEIGYAPGGDHGDLPAIQECLSLGWIRYSHDASVGGRHSDRPYQRRDIYILTEKGRQQLNPHSR